MAVCEAFARWLGGRQSREGIQSHIQLTALFIQKHWMKRHQLQLTNYPGGKANTDLRVSSSKTLQAQQQAPLQGSTGQLPGSHWRAARFLCSALAVQGASVVFSYRKHGHRVNILVPNLSKQGRKRS